MAEQKHRSPKPTDTPSPAHGEANQATVYKILIAISFVHLFNDSIQSVIPAIFPILKDNLSLTFTQIGWISFAINFTSSIIQPVIGYLCGSKTDTNSASDRYVFHLRRRIHSRVCTYIYPCSVRGRSDRIRLGDLSP